MCFLTLWWILCTFQCLWVCFLTLWWLFCLAHWNNSLRIDMSPPLWYIILIQSQPVFALSPVCRNVTFSLYFINCKLNHTYSNYNLANNIIKIKVTVSTILSDILNRNFSPKLISCVKFYLELCNCQGFLPSFQIIFTYHHLFILVFINCLELL
jgi:hypothetical protein